MKYVRFLLPIMALLYACSESKLYQNREFELTPTSVKQGPWHAEVTPDGGLRTNYLPAHGRGIDRVLRFKFSLNQQDNERPPFADHLLLLPADTNRYNTPLLIFARTHAAELSRDTSLLTLSPQIKAYEVTFRLDLNPVLAAISAQGFYEAADGSRIERINSVHVAGANRPLGWHFGDFSAHPEAQLFDRDGDGIYTTKIDLQPPQEMTLDEAGFARWQPTATEHDYPSFRSDFPLLNSLYQLSLVELEANIRTDSTFMAGAKWPGVWTRDISYAGHLSLALLRPDIMRRSLIAKRQGKKIIQDTGTGGAWPVSTDRMTWTLAAWEVYLTTGDKKWLEDIYATVSASAQRDLQTAFSLSTGLMRGETSFLDWREQTYPRWMEAKDIYASFALSTNAVHYRSFSLLAAMAAELGKGRRQHEIVAGTIAESLNRHLWSKEYGFYLQYLQSEEIKLAEERFATLGNALTILFAIADEKKQAAIMENAPLLPYGISCIYPQTEGIPPYHNDGIWPFVVSYWTWAAAKAGNSAAVEHGLASIYRAAALFLTNKENFVADNGNFQGTEINSDRQLWSVAGNLATVFRVFFGMRLTPDSLTFQPFVPRAYSGIMQLEDFRYRKARLHIRLHGYGNKVESFHLDGQRQNSNSIASNLSGEHKIDIYLNKQLEPATIRLRTNRYAPAAVKVSHGGDSIIWQPVAAVNDYTLFANGRKIASTKATSYTIQSPETLVMLQVRAEKQGFLSRPLLLYPAEALQIFQPRGRLSRDYSGYSGRGYHRSLKDDAQAIVFSVNVPKDGIYRIDFRYANGAGPINTDNKAAIRTLRINGQSEATVVFPQRGLDAWADWGYSSASRLDLSAGNQTLELVYTKNNANMNEQINTTHVDHLRLIYIKPKQAQRDGHM
jgi:hypothetical protein